MATIVPIWLVLLTFGIFVTSDVEFINNNIFNCNHSKNLLELLNRTSKSISDALIYLNTVKPYLTVDGLLGVIMVREQSTTLLRLLKHINVHHHLKFVSNIQTHFIRRNLKKLESQSNTVAAAIQHTGWQDPAYFQGIHDLLNMFYFFI